MNIRQMVETGVPALWSELEESLVGQSRLPGPRANLELAAAFADACAAAGPNSALVERLEQWADLSPAETPDESGREFLPFCALQGLGAIYGDLEPPAREHLAELLQSAARDSRWRIREAVAMAVQRIAERAFSQAAALLTDWSASADLLQWRAIVAALAHPPVLTEAGAARYALDMAEKALLVLAAVSDLERKTEEYRVLRQGLEYAISVFAAALPEEGFARMAEWAAPRHPEVLRILRTNLKKKRLSGPHAADSARLLDSMR